MPSNICWCHSIIDHSILLDRLSHSFGVTDMALSWIQSYLTDRSYSVRLGQCSSPTVSCRAGVPQGSVLRLMSLQTWFYTNGMALNPDKSNAILPGTAQRASSYSSLTSVDVAGTPVQLAKNTKLLGVTLDTNLTMWEHTKRVCQSCFYHIRTFRHIRAVLDKSTAADIAAALVSSRLDHANSVLYSSPSRCLKRLQRIQNSVTRIVLQQPSLSSRDTLQQLQWLPVKWRMHFKLASLTYKVLHTSTPSYLSERLHPYVPSHTLRSSSSANLYVPHTNLHFGSRYFTLQRQWSEIFFLPLFVCLKH